MSYFTEAFKFKQMPLIFLIIMITCALTVGNLVQSNSLSIPLHFIEVSPLFLGMIMALLFFATTTLNISKIVNIILSIVPLMTLSYLLLSAIVLYKFRDNILPSLLLIAENFMSFECFKLGLFGSFILETFAIIKVATFRGIFATDIGLGLEGIVHSSIEHRKNDHNFRVKQSLISMISPFVVMIITFITTMVLLVTDVWHGELESTNMCIKAFITAFNSKIVYYILVCIMFCFSFTTVFTWFFCTQSVISYVFKKDYYIKIWSIVFALIIPIGSVMKVSLLWQIADLAVAIMILINTTAIIMMIPKNRLMFDYSEINKH